MEPYLYTQQEKKSSILVPKECVGNVPNGTLGTENDGKNSEAKHMTSPTRPGSDVDDKKCITWADVARGSCEPPATTYDTLMPL